MVRNLILLPLILTLVQKPVEKPKVHADFQFGSYPSSRQAEEVMKEDLAREILVAYHEGWQLDKIAKTFKVPITDVTKLSDRIEDERLGGRRNDFDIRPFIPVIRERDYDSSERGLAPAHPGIHQSSREQLERHRRNGGFARRNEGHPERPRHV